MTWLCAAGGSLTEVPGVNFYSPVGIVSGLGSAGRGYLAAMKAAGIPVSTIPVHEIFFHQPSAGIPWRRDPPRFPVALVHVNGDSVHRFLRFHGRSFARARYRIGLWVWELPSLRDEWAEELHHFDEIWVPSAFCRRAVESVTTKPVVVIPYAVPPHGAPRPSVRERLGIDAGAFVFLYIFDASSFIERKNPQCLLDAFEAGFKPDDRVSLVLKVSGLDGNPDFARYLDALSARDRRFLVVRETMAEDDVAGLVAAADCYVSPHRSEGFGLTVAEAMGFGVPVIATDYGGTADFVTRDSGFPLRYDLAELNGDCGPYPSGAIWAEPSREHLSELLRGVVANADAARVIGQNGRERVLREFSAAAVGSRIGARLATIAASQALRPAGA